MKRHVLAVSLVFVIAGVTLWGAVSSPILAQDDAPESPLHALLALVPASAATPRTDDALWLLSISYADYRAIDAARPGVPTFDAWAELKAALDAEDFTPMQLWSANIWRLVSGDADLMTRLMAFDEDFAEMYGFDCFDIDRSLAFGQPPQQGAVYGGEFDLAAIEAALTVHTYEPHTVNGVEIWCGPIGCENGQEPGNWLPDQNGPRDPQTLKIDGRYPIFGGQTGQQVPIALVPGFIANTPNWDVMQAITLAISGEGKSVLALPEFRALTDTITGTDAALLQVWYVHPLEFVGVDVAAILAQLDPAQDWDTILEQYAEAIPTPDALPLYDLAAMVDWQEGTDQVHGVAAVYRDEDTARRAAEELTTRIANMIGWELVGPAEPLIAVEGIGVTMDAPRVIYHAATQRWIAIAAARYPMPANELSADGVMSNLPTSGWLYSLWVRSYQAGFFTPLYLAELE